MCDVNPKATEWFKENVPSVRLVTDTYRELLDSPDYLTANGLPIVFANLDLASALDSPGFSAMNSFVFSEFIFVISE